MPHSRLWILWSAMLLSLGVYAALPLLLPAPARPLPPTSLPWVGAALGVALALGLASLVLRRVALVGPARAGRLDIDRPDGARRWLAISLALWALSESVAVLGVVLWALYREPGLLHPFLWGAALLGVIHAPRAASLRDPVTRSPARPDAKIG